VKNRFVVTLVAASALLAAQLAFAVPLAVRRVSRSDGSDAGWIFVVGFFVLTVAIIALVFYLDRQRSKKIAAAATALGLTFRRKATDADRGLPAGCYLGNLGHSRVVSNVLQAAQTAELALTLFDYQYTTGYGKTSSTSQQTITRIQSPLLNLPTFLLFPETFFSKMGKMFGGTDINFPESPAFSEKYILRGGDETAIRAIFNPAVREALTPLQRLTIEGGGNLLFIFRAGRRLKPDEFAPRIDEDKRILALFFEAQRASG
jgi:hypothetical protein